jgi:NadR type nicotinamide-nucleotide adenylyltransferase
MEKTISKIASACVRIVLFGPESTGKSTLAEELATHYKTMFVPEYMRQYLQHKWDHQRAVCTKSDLIPIAEGQMQLENNKAKLVDKILFCDTNLLQIKVYSEIYYDGYCPPEIVLNIKKNSYDLYFLCGIDVPWVGDDLRDKPNEREYMFECFEGALKAQNVPFIVLEGTKRQRFNTAIAHIDQLISTRN